MTKKNFKAYDNNIRDKALALIKKKKKLKDIAILLNVSSRTLLRWKKLAQVGQKYAKVNYKRGKVSEINHKVMLLILKNYPQAKQREIKDFYINFTGKYISQPTVSKYIKRISNSQTKEMSCQ